MALAEALILSKCPHWRVFGSATWSRPVVPREATQKKLVFAFLYKAAGIAKVRYKRLVWATRHERGERTGREHYHWLIGAEEWQPTIGQMFTLNQTWDNQPLCGFARHHVFDERLNGVEYVTKCLSGSALGDTLAGDFYESGKFTFRDSEVTLSGSLVRLVGHRFAVGARRLERDTVEKRAECEMAESPV